MAAPHNSVKTTTAQLSFMMLSPRKIVVTKGAGRSSGSLGGACSCKRTQGTPTRSPWRGPAGGHNVQPEVMTERCGHRGIDDGRQEICASHVKHEPLPLLCKRMAVPGREVQEHRHGSSPVHPQANDPSDISVRKMNLRPIHLSKVLKKRIVMARAAKLTK